MDFQFFDLESKQYSTVCVFENEDNLKSDAIEQCKKILLFFSERCGIY